MLLDQFIIKVFDKTPSFLTSEEPFYKWEVIITRVFLEFDKI
jgi:hypothetical protein